MTEHHLDKNKNLRPTGFASHFRLLGLKRGECRTDVIRSAAQAMSVDLSHQENHSLGNLSDRRRARIAFAAYRLLDPRERRDLYERVQLSYPIARDDAEEATFSFDSMSRETSKTLYELPVLSTVPFASRRPSQVVLMSQPVIDEAIDGNDNESLVDAEIVSDEDNMQARIMERRGIVRLIRELDRMEPRSVSALDWIRARLGI